MEINYSFEHGVRYTIEVYYVTTRAGKYDVSRKMNNKNYSHCRATSRIEVTMNDWIIVEVMVLYQNVIVPSRLRHHTTTFFYLFPLSVSSLKVFFFYAKFQLNLRYWSTKSVIWFFEYWVFPYKNSSPYKPKLMKIHPTWAS